MTWLSGFAADDVNLDDVLALRPAAAARARELEAALWKSALDHRTIELVRVRVGQLLGLPGQRLDTEAPLSEREQAALGFAEQYVLDPHGITDPQTDRLHECFTEPELTALTFCVAVYDALGRVQVTLAAEPSSRPA